MRTLTCKVKYDRQPIVTKDGGTVALDWFQPRELAKIPSDAPVVLVLHGLTGMASLLYTCTAYAALLSYTVKHFTAATSFAPHTLFAAEVLHGPHQPHAVLQVEVVRGTANGSAPA